MPGGWGAVIHKLSVPGTTDCNDGMPLSFEELCNFLNESSDKQYSQQYYTAYSQPILKNIFSEAHFQGSAG